MKGYKGFRKKKAAGLLLRNGNIQIRKKDGFRYVSRRNM